MKRASLSISNNLSEVSARKSKREKIRFFEISRSSVVVIDNCFKACKALNFLSDDDLVEAGDRLVEMFKLISGLIDSNTV